MPRLTKSVPKYRRHKASGQAVVTLSGKDFYLGPYGSKVSHLEFDRLTAEWMQNGRRLTSFSAESLRIVQLIAEYWKFAKSYYVKNDKPTDEQPGIKAALKQLKLLYRDTLVTDFGPLALKGVRQQMIDNGNSRGYINKNIGRIKRAFKWGVENELVPSGVYEALTAVAGLRRGKSNAKEMAPVAPVDDRIVEQTITHLPAVVIAMVRFQRCTGCRPSEVCMLRSVDIDRTGDIWIYRPASHKMEHHGRERVIPIGPNAQSVLELFLDAGAEYCFVPLRSTKQHFTHRSYRDAIHRACTRANLPKWNPNQLRHSAATEIRAKYGIEAAQVTLGHANANVTQVYAERDLEKAKEIMRELG